MGEISRRTKAEFRQLPLLLLKVAGGIAAAVGFPAAIFTATGHTRSGHILPWVIGGGIGLLLFVLSGKALNKRLPEDAVAARSGGDALRGNLLSWGLLLSLTAAFLGVVYFLTR